MLFDILNLVSDPDERLQAVKWTMRQGDIRGVQKWNDLLVANSEYAMHKFHELRDAYGVIVLQR